MSKERYYAELLRGCAEVAHAPAPSPGVRELFGLESFSEAEHTEIFVLELAPEASIYLTPGAHLGGEPLDRLEGFYRALGVNDVRDPMSLSSQLAFLASLIDGFAEGDHEPAKLAALDRVRSAFLFEHLLVWVPVYASVAARLAPALAPWSEALLEVLEVQFDQLSLGEWNWSPAVFGTRLGAADAAELSLAELLISPYLSGFVLTRKLLFSKAPQYGLAPRIGTRRFIVSSMLDQDPVATVALIRDEASAQLDSWRQLSSRFGKPLASWAEVCASSIDSMS